MLKTKESIKAKSCDMKPRFIVKPKKLPPETKSAIIKVIKAENKTISKVKKKARLEGLRFDEIHHRLTLYAMREHLKHYIKEFQKTLHT